MPLAFVKIVLSAVAHPWARTAAGVVLIALAATDPAQTNAAVKAAAGVLLCGDGAQGQ